MVYSPDDVFKFVGYYGYQASIALAKDEEVVSISMGDSTAWQIMPSGNIVFIKPIEDDATTNMTMITNKRTYFFELYAEETSDIRDPDIAFNIRFIYPDDAEKDNIMHFAQATSEIDEIDLSNPEKYNFYYSISGNEEIAPIKIFDDGRFTYMQFRDINNQIPGVFEVDEDLKEHVVNYRPARAHENIIVVERVYRKMSLRIGKKIVCIFNENFAL